METKKLKKLLHLISVITFNVFAVLFGLIVIVNSLFASKNVSNLLTDYVFKDKPADVTWSTGKEPVRYKTWYSSVTDTLNGNGEIAWTAQIEGTVLLKNENNALPLAKGEKVSLFGVTAYDPMYCLDGAGNNKINDPQAYAAGEKSEINRREFFYDQFEKAGLIMNKSLYDWYNEGEPFGYKNEGGKVVQVPNPNNPSQGRYYWRRDTIGYWGSERDAGNSTVPSLSEAPWSEVSKHRNSSEFGSDTTAIYITGRMTNEASDLSNDYLTLTSDELTVIENLGKEYNKVIVIFNQANAPQNNIPKLLAEKGVEAALWVGFPGSDGIRAIADLLVGINRYTQEEISPSGGLSAAWYAGREYNPSMANFKTNTNVVNMEGMYVGYRYAETRYEDTLDGAANASVYDYATSVSYPFGYGLSYSNFSFSGISVSADPDPAKNYYSGGLMAYNNDKFVKGEYLVDNPDADDLPSGYTGNYGKKREELRKTGSNPGDCDDIILKVTVTNDGPRAGQKNVQIYLQKPISDTDRQHGVQKPAVQLVGFGKTKLLAVGASEEIEIKIDANKWFASYDSKLSNSDGTQGGYTLTPGDYKLVVASNSHEAVNSLHKAKNNGGITSDKFDNTFGAGDGALVQTVNVSQARSDSYKYWTQGTTDDVHNLFDAENPSAQAKIFSRYDWDTTAALSGGLIGINGNGSGFAGTSSGSFHNGNTLDSSKIDQYEQYYNVEFDDTPYTFGWSTTNHQLYQMIGREYDPARGASEEDVKMWKEIVGQMSKTDFETLFSTGLRQTTAIQSIGKPATNDQNASNGFEWRFGMASSDSGNKAADVGFARKFESNGKKAYPTGYPCEGIIAATFNTDIAYLVGQAIGEDALWGGTSGLYGFGLGLQRNPYHGRAGEFYSDDSFLTGMMGGYATKGAQEKGCYVYNKHFVLNDQETNRTDYSAWIDEQTMREIYLRPFEMAIEIGDAMNVMIAFNKFGGSWTGSSYSLMTRWLRGEAGMAGFAISDWYPAGGENLGWGVLAGTCLLDGPYGGSGYSAGVDARYDNRLVEAVTRILYTVANSNAMNFWGDSTRSKSFDPLWYSARDAILPPVTIIVEVFFALSCAFVAGTTGWILVDKYILKKED